MRRVLIVSIAILALTASSAVMAGEQQVSDRLLEILKERQIISENEYAELSDLADQMQEDQNSVDQQLEALDASISEYLAKEGEDEASVSVSHKKGKGFGFSTGTFEMFFGGLFQFQYYGLDVDEGQDTNNFDVKEARIQIDGKAFVEDFTYKFQWMADSGVTLLDAWANYKVCDGVQVRFGQFKTPYSRQALNSTGRLALFDRSIVVGEYSTGRDIGVMFWDVFAFEEGEDMAIEWALAFVNGDGTNVNGNDNNWLGWVARLGFYPFGFVKYGESDLANTQDMKFGIAGSYYSYRNRPSGDTDRTDGIEFDAVVAWSGLYLTGEWHKRKTDEADESSYKDNGWFAQAGFVIPDTEFEVLGRYSRINWKSSQTGLSSTSGWQLGVAWYPGQEGHPFKALLSFGHMEVDESNGAAAGSSPKSPEYDIADVALNYGDTYFLRLAFQLDW